MAGISYEYRTSESEVSHGYLYDPVAGLLADVPAGALVADIGCGNGSFLSLFRNRGWQLYGTDYSSTGIEIARASYPDIKFSLGNAESMPEELTSRAGQFDVALCTEVIEHVYNPRGLLKTCHSLLKPKGRLVLTTPYHGYMKNLMLAATGKLDSHFTVLWDHGHIKFWSHKTMRAVLIESGFTDIKFSGAGRVPWLWKSMVVHAEKG
jgi:2-polyprenyl-6-hydroxyphenyl methylase/3-demethylubiquinone-9 3-methyltransferase